MPATPGNDAEMWIQTIEAFGGSRPAELGYTQLWMALINAILAFTPSTGNSGWAVYPITNGPALANGVPLFLPTTGTLISDYLPIITTPFGGLTPQLDLSTITGQPGFITARGGQPPLAGGNAIPLWLSATNPGANFGILVPGPAPGPRWAPSYGSAMASSPWVNGPPNPASPLYVQTGTQVYLTISQDGTSRSAVAASILAVSAVTLPFVIHNSGGSQNDSFVWTGTGGPSDPNIGGGGRAPEIFTIAPGTYTTLGGPGGLEAAIGAATGALSGEAFSTFATITDNGGGVLILTDNGGGAAGTGNSFSANQSLPNDVTTQLGFHAPGQLQGGVGGATGSTVGAGILLVATSSPS